LADSPLALADFLFALADFLHTQLPFNISYYRNLLNPTFIMRFLSYYPPFSIKKAANKEHLLTARKINLIIIFYSFPELITC
ncbi:hypothetical protein CHH62_21605, partial [Niallia circulans]